MLLTEAPESVMALPAAVALVVKFPVPVKPPLKVMVLAAPLVFVRVRSWANVTAPPKVSAPVVAVMAYVPVLPATVVIALLIVLVCPVFTFNVAFAAPEPVPMRIAPALKGVIVPVAKAPVFTCPARMFKLPV